jgi:hypothetical protein
VPKFNGSIKSLEDRGKAIDKINKLQSKLSLGYMGLTSAANVYNDAI